MLAALTIYVHVSNHQDRNERRSSAAADEARMKTLAVLELGTGCWAGLVQGRAGSLVPPLSPLPRVLAPTSAPPNPVTTSLGRFKQSKSRANAR